MSHGGTIFNDYVGRSKALRINVCKAMAGQLKRWLSKYLP